MLFHALLMSLMPRRPTAPYDFQDVRASASIFFASPGVCVFPRHGDRPAARINNADVAMPGQEAEAQHGAIFHRRAAAAPAYY